MKVFADASYWIALLHRNDQLHSAAVAACQQLTGVEIVTTDEVLVEVLNFFGGRGEQLRQLASQAIVDIRSDQHTHVLEQSRQSFDLAFALYRQRSDKQFSLTDCRSFDVMQSESIESALTDDHHFVQAGFRTLL